MYVFVDVTMSLKIWSERIVRRAFNVTNTGKGIFKSWKNVLSGRVERQAMFMKCGEENAKGSREAQPGSYQFY